jgi:2,3-bisphosphoglycerate-dependent phosphoglycerate mutase
MAYLALVRHGESEYNKKGIWAGWDNPDLTEKGIEEAKVAGSELKDISFDLAYSSVLLRAKHTLQLILESLNLTSIPVTENRALNERNYGDFTAKNKWEVKEALGEENFLKLRRAWDYPVPNGESLKQVYEREIPYFESEILPHLKEGKNVIVASSGNALRALVKHLDTMPDEEVSLLEIATGEIYLYQIDSEGNVTSKELRHHRENTV